MKHHIHTLILLVCSFVHTSGQDYFLRQYSGKEGLNDPYVYALGQDGNGYMWIGTAEGLYKFNGLEFQAFTTENGLAENYISVLYTDSRGILWIGHQNGTISRLNEYGFAPLNETFSPGGEITDITEDENGFIWITIQNLGLLCIDPDGGITPVYFPQEETRLTQIASLGGDHFLIGTPGKCLSVKI